LAYLDVDDDQVAIFIRRFLDIRHLTHSSNASARL
jgi:hypothetical protein